LNSQQRVSFIKLLKTEKFINNILGALLAWFFLFTMKWIPRYLRPSGKCMGMWWSSSQRFHRLTLHYCCVDFPRPKPVCGFHWQRIVVRVHILIGKYTVQLLQLKPSKQNLNNVSNNSTFIEYITIELEKEPNCFF